MDVKELIADFIDEIRFKISVNFASSESLFSFVKNYPELLWNDVASMSVSTYSSFMIV